MTDETSKTVIGHPAHSIFRMSETPGRINGIAEIFQSAEKISVDRMVGFDLLADGETVHFDAPAHIEVVSFDSERSELGWQDSLRLYAVDIERGGSLVGPVVYRRLSEQQGTELKTREEKSNRYDLRAKQYFIAFWVAASLFLSYFEGSFVPLVASAALGLFVILFKKCSDIHGGKPRKITASKVAIMSPKKKVWMDA